MAHNIKTEMCIIFMGVHNIILRPSFRKYVYGGGGGGITGNSELWGGGQPHLYL